MGLRLASPDAAGSNRGPIASRCPALRAASPRAWSARHGKGARGRPGPCPARPGSCGGAAGCPSPASSHPTASQSAPWCGSTATLRHLVGNGWCRSIASSQHRGRAVCSGARPLPCHDSLLDLSALAATAVIVRTQGPLQTHAGFPNMMWKAKSKLKLLARSKAEHQGFSDFAGSGPYLSRLALLICS